VTSSRCRQTPLRLVVAVQKLTWCSEPTSSRFQDAGRPSRRHSRRPTSSTRRKALQQWIIDRRQGPPHHRVAGEHRGRASRPIPSCSSSRSTARTRTSALISGDKALACQQGPMALSPSPHEPQDRHLEYQLGPAADADRGSVPGREAARHALPAGNQVPERAVSRSAPFNDRGYTAHRRSTARRAITASRSSRACRSGISTAATSAASRRCRHVSALFDLADSPSAAQFLLFPPAATSPTRHQSEIRPQARFRRGDEIWSMPGPSPAFPRFSSATSTSRRWSMMSGRTSSCSRIVSHTPVETEGLKDVISPRAAGSTSCASSRRRPKALYMVELPRQGLGRWPTVAAASTTSGRRPGCRPPAGNRDPEGGARLDAEFRPCAGDGAFRPIGCGRSGRVLELAVNRFELGHGDGRACGPAP
jgi:hypothetical protein